MNQAPKEGQGKAEKDEKTGRKRPVFVVELSHDKNKPTTKGLYAR
jgi:hypothetical protein